MPNIQSKISSHNKYILASTHDTTDSRTCNCRKPEDCPLSGQCLTKSIVYQATVKSADNKPDETYIGLTANTFKTRFNGHTASFKHTNKRQSTELSKYIWKLKEGNIGYTINWQIVRRAKSYDNITNTCSLCLWEKYFIINKPHMASLNKRNELVSSCRHRAKYKLANIKSPT